MTTSRISGPLIPGTDIPAVASVALSRLTACFAGNASAVPKLESQSAAAHILQGAVLVKMKSEVAKVQIKGRAPQGEQAASAQDAQTRAHTAAESFIGSVEILKALEETLDRDAGFGWAMEPLKAKPQLAQKSFCRVETCDKCAGAGTVTCPDCRSQGQVTCTHCRGSGRDNEVHDPSCNWCRGSGRALCTRCSGQKRLSCVTCAGSGAWTDVWSATTIAAFSFTLDETAANPEGLEAAKFLGLREIASEGHAQIARETPAVDNGTVIFPLTARLTVGRGVFGIEGKSHEALVGGLHGCFLHIEPVLDPYVKPGIAALSRLSKGPLAAQALMGTACKYRLVRDALRASAAHSKKAVYHAILGEYPLVISDKYARAAASHAAGALAALSARPRHLGLALGALVAAMIFALYWLDLRPGLPAALEAKNLGRFAPEADIADWLLGWAACILVIRALVSHGLKKILPPEVTAAGGAPVSAGRHTFYALPATFIPWLALAARARPEWILPLLHKAGM